MREFPQSWMIRFAKNSCYLFALARASEIATGFELSAESVFREALVNRNISETCFIHDAVAVLNKINPPPEGKRWEVEKVEKDYKVKKNDILIEHWNKDKMHHFRLPEWNSMFYPTMSETGGEIVGYRVVRLVNRV